MRTLDLQGPRLATVVGWALALPVLLALARSSAFIEDELLSVAHAVEATRGVVLYRDQFEFTAPLSHWALILLVPMGFGPLATAHLLLGVVVAATMEIIRRLVVAWGGGPWAGAGAMLGYLLALRVWPAWSHHWAVWFWLMALLWGSLAWSQLPGSSDKLRWGAMGLVWALAFATLQSDGLVVGLGIVAGAWGMARPRSREAWGAGAALALGFGSVLLGVGGLWWLQGAWHGGVMGTLVFPLTGYKQAGGVNDLPWFGDLAGRLHSPSWGPGALGRAFHLLGWPALVLAVPALASVVAWRKTRAEGKPPLWLPAVGAGWGALGVALLGRADLVHLVTAAPPALALGALGLGTLARWGAAWRWCPGLAWLWVVLGLGWWGAEWRAAPEVWWGANSPDERLSKHPLLKVLRDRVKPGDRVVAMPYGGLFATYLAPPASHWLLLFPPAWGYNAPDDWAEHWRQVERLQAKWVVISPWPPLKEGSLAPWVKDLPRAYRLVGPMAPQHPGWGPAYLYEREGQGSSPLNF